MNAINLLDNSVKQVIEVDNIIQKFFDDASYYLDFGNYITILTKAFIKESKIDYGHRFCYYKINDELYELVHTNSYKELYKMFKYIDSKKAIKQIQLNFEL